MRNNNNNNAKHKLQHRATKQKLYIYNTRIKISKHKTKSWKKNCFFKYYIPSKLTLNHASTSLANNHYLGTLMYSMTLRTKCRFYERTYLIFNCFFIKRTNFHDRLALCENLKLVFILIFMCNDANWLWDSGWELSGHLRIAQHCFIPTNQFNTF